VLVGRHSAGITYTATPPGAERVLSIDRSGEWRVWSTETRWLLARRRPPSPHAYSAALFDRAGSRIGWSSSEGSAIYLWNLDDPPDAELLKLRPGQVGVDMSVPAFDAGGHWMAASYGYQSVSFWPLGLPHARVLTGHTQGVFFLRFTADSRYLVSGARDGLRFWPLRLGEGTQQRVDIGSDYYCYGTDVNPHGETVALAASLAGLFVVEGPTHAARRVLLPEPGTFFENAAFDPTGRRLATVEAQWQDLDEHVIRDVDLGSGAVRTWRYREREGSEPVEAPSVGFAWDGRLVLGGNDGVFRWETGADRPTALLEAPGKFVAVTTTPTAAGSAAVVGQQAAQLAGSWDVKAGQAIVFDLTKGSHWPVPGHGSDIQYAALEASGSILVTGDSAGTVRVGSASGGAPHQLVGHSTGINAIAVSPDRKWIASAAGTEIRLWPMPDIAKPPLHTLPHGELMATLHALTNVRAVKDQASPTGYKLDIGPFPGWKDVPTW
jgi:WD40 repeat protein